MRDKGVYEEERNKREHGSVEESERDSGRGSGRGSGKGSGKGSGNSYAVDYNDERFTSVETDKQGALTELEQTYGGIIDKSDKYFTDQINAAKQWGEQQSQLQQEKTDFAIEQIEQQKKEAEEDYIDEQSGAYADWKEQDSEFGAEAEQRAAQGMSNTGYSESTKARNWNTYQTRLTAARVTFQRITQNFNNQMTEARLQNNVVLAEIAFNTLQKELELNLQGFQYKNGLLLEQFNKQMEVDQMYYTRWQDVLNQINTENALAEQIRQFNESMALQREQLDLQREQLALQQASFSGSSGGGGEGYTDLGTPIPDPSPEAVIKYHNHKAAEADTTENKDVIGVAPNIGVGTNNRWL